MTATHIVIPDTQVKPGVAIDHLGWIGRYIVEKFDGREDITVIHLGDHWDMPSLSSYDRGKKAMEGRRVDLDIEAGDTGFDALNDPFVENNQGVPVARQWWPRRVYLRGNHEDRVTRAIECDATLDGILSMDCLLPPRGWEIVPFLHVVEIDGVSYSHYFYNPMSGRPWGGMIGNRLQKIGRSFTMGHQQTLDYGLRYVGNRSQHGLVAGSCYLHDEGYKGPQGNDHWRGIIVKHQVEGGSYDPMFVSLDYLCRRFEGVSLDRFTPRMFA